LFSLLLLLQVYELSVSSELACLLPQDAQLNLKQVQV
jgi:hypothetical protein